MHFMFRKRRAQGIEKRAFYVWRQSYLALKFMGDRALYANRALQKRRIRRVFESWRGVTHVWFRERIQGLSGRIKGDLQRKFLKEWSSKVDAQLIMVAELEQKIKAEVENREALTVTYERSLNQGVTRLNTETVDL